MKVTPYYLALAKDAGFDDPVFRQAVPAIAELDDDPEAAEDPIGEERPEHRPCASLIHRYRDRALLIPTWSCSLHCRHCFRRCPKSRSQAPEASPEALRRSLGYVRAQPQIREVIVTGGDPFTLGDDEIVALLEDAAAIPHVRTLRLHTRMPVVNPFRITDRLCARLARLAKPLWIATQFNHPNELSAESIGAVGRLNQSGSPVLNQAVLLKGVNDRLEILEALLLRLIEAQVKPYYLHHLDRAPGVRHFRVSIRRGRELIQSLRGRIPGYAIPHYVLDIPGGLGKVPLDPSAVQEQENGVFQVRAPDGSIHTYCDDL
jgi:lysine 2,3-aminomutase